MADVQKTVEILFGGKNELTGVIGTIESDFNKFDAAVGNIATPLDLAGKAVLKLDAALAALVVGGMALAIKESSEFNKSFALISTSVTATGGDLGKYRDDILAYSTNSVRSLQDINAALYTAAQAGVDWTNSLEFIGKAEQLSVANNANLNTTVDLLTGTMNAYGFTMKDVQHINDVFFTSTLIGKQTIDELGQSMGQVVGIAANSGVSFEALSAAIATMTAKGMDTANAITGMKGVITSIISPSVEAATAARALGLDFSLTELTAKGFAGMMNEIMVKTGGSKEELVKLFPEVRAMNGAFMLTGDGMKFFNEALEKTTNSAGSAEAAYKKMVDTFSNQSQMLVNTVKGVLIEVGTTLEPMAARIAGSVGNVLKGVKIGLDQGAFDPIFAVFDSFSKDLSLAVANIAGKFPEAFRNVDFSTLSEAISDAGDVLTEALGSATTEDITAAMQDMADSFASLISVTKGMGEVFKPVIDVIRGAVTAFNDLDSGTKELVGNLMGMSMLYKLFGPISLAIVALGMDMKDTQYLFDVGASAIENGINTVKVAVYSLALIFATAAQAAAEMLDYIPGYDAQAGIDRTTERVKILSQGLDEAQTALAVSSNKTRDAFLQQGQYADGAAVKTTNYSKLIDTLPAEKTTELKLTGEANVAAAIEALPAEKRIVVGYIEDEYGRHEITAAIDATVPKEKTVDVKLGIERLKEEAKTMQLALEWKAKLDIVEVEANVKNLKTMFDSVDTGIKSTGDLLGKLFGSFKDAGAWERDLIESSIKLENERRTQEFDLQKKLIEQQITLNDLKIRRYESGDFAITVNGEGLKPHLEAIMWEILGAIQIRANESASEFLLGVG